MVSNFPFYFSQTDEGEGEEGAQPGGPRDGEARFPAGVVCRHCTGADKCCPFITKHKIKDIFSPISM